MRSIRLAVLALACTPTAEPPEPGATAAATAASDAAPIAAPDATPIAAPDATPIAAPAPVPAPVASAPPAIDLATLALPPSIREDELAKDLAVFERVVAALPVRSMAATRTVLSPDGKGCSTIELGFDLRAENCVIGGFYSTCFVHALTHHGDAFDVRAGCRTSERRWPELATVFAAIDAATLSRRGFVRVDAVATFSQHDDAGARVATDALAAVLGPASGAEVPADLRASYEQLVDPRAQLVLGRVCGAGGSPPAGRGAAHDLVVAGRADLLRDALRGMNPVGRIYGYLGLTALGANTADDDATFVRLRALELPLATCNGCMPSQTPAGALDLAPLNLTPG